MTGEKRSQDPLWEGRWEEDRNGCRIEDGRGEGRGGSQRVVVKQERTGFSESGV